jgi:galactoside O-acetyltransferase
MQLGMLDFHSSTLDGSGSENLVFSELRNILSAGDWSFMSYYSPEELSEVGFRDFGINVQVSKRATFINPGNIVLGSNVRIDDYVLITASSGFLRIGNFVHVGALSYFNCNGDITFEDFSGVSQGVKIYSASDDFSGAYLTNPTVPLKFRSPTMGKVVIRRHALIGSNTVILPNVEVGEGAAVGAQSLVTSNLSPWYIHFGSPTKPIKPRSKNLLSLEMKLLEEIKNGNY